MRTTRWELIPRRWMQSLCVTLIVTAPNRMQGKLTTALLTLRHSLQTSINESEYNEKLVQIIIQGHPI